MGIIECLILGIVLLFVTAGEIGEDDPSVQEQLNKRNLYK